jgi:acyl-CoA dehydrogenase
MHLHGSLRISNEMPFSGWMVAAEVMGLADGPTENHKVVLARQLLKGYQPHEGLFPRGHLPAVRESARAKYADFLEHEVGNL